MATQGTVKALSPRVLSEIGVEIILVNAFHLYLRPGIGLIKKAGGIHKFIGWSKPILSDSGGYQVFSLSPLFKVEDKGVFFTSSIDGSKHFFSPEDVMAIQLDMGCDIIMPLDECLSYPSTFSRAEEALRRTNLWLKQSYEFIKKKKETGDFSEPILFAIIQGSSFPELRQKAADELLTLNFFGYALGGLSVGEPKPLTYELTEVMTEILPEDKPRYFMGLGTPEDLSLMVKRGIDLFDSVVPTRLARHGHFLSTEGQLNIRNARFKEDFSPLEEGCFCYSCQEFTRSYLRHLIMAREILGFELLSIHNLYFLIQYLAEIRKKLKNTSYRP